VTNVASQVDEAAFLRDYRRGVPWDTLTRFYHSRRSNLNRILVDNQEPLRPPLHDGGEAHYYTLELADGRFTRIRM
jgi:hypothetical protein